MSNLKKKSPIPLLSIIIPSYNYARFLPDSIESILNEEFQDYEIVLIDDGSTDESPAISERYASLDHRIRYIRHEKNQGIFYTAFEALKESKGTYIHYFSADDIYLPGFLSKLMAPLLANKEIGLACCDIGYFQNGSAKIEVKKLLETQKTSRFFTPSELMPLFQKTQFWVPGACCIVKKEFIIQHEHYDPKLENICDWFLFHRIALFEGLYYIPENLLAMRVHDQTYTKQVKKNKQRRRATYWHLLHILEKKKEVRQKFKEAALLDFVFKDLSWKILFHPKYWHYLPAIKKKRCSSR